MIQKTCEEFSKVKRLLKSLANCCLEQNFSHFSFFIPFFIENLFYWISPVLWYFSIAKGYLRLLVLPYEDEISMHLQNIEELFDDLKDLSKDYRRDLLEYKGLQESMEYLLWREPFLLTHIMNLDFVPEKSFYMDDSENFCLKRLFMERSKKRIIYSILEVSGFSPCLFLLFSLKYFLFIFLILGVLYLVYFFYKKFDQYHLINIKKLNDWTGPQILLEEKT
jgi:hypothetical protein